MIFDLDSSREKADGQYWVIPSIDRVFSSMIIADRVFLGSFIDRIKLGYLQRFRGFDEIESSERLNDFLTAWNEVNNDSHFLNILGIGLHGHPSIPRPGFKNLDVFFDYSDQRTAAEALLWAYSDEGRALLARKHTDDWRKPMNVARDLSTSNYGATMDALEKTGANVLPLFERFGAFEKEFTNGNHLVFQACIDNIDAVDESAVELDQIWDYRSDSEAHKKVVRLHNWLKDGVEAQSRQHAVDMVGQKLDDYAWALKKHGIKTKLGALSCIVAGLAADSLFVETLQAGALGVASSSIWLAERRVELENIQRTNSNAAVAVIYELKQKRRNWLRALIPPWN